MRKTLLSVLTVLGLVSTQPASAALKIFACEPEWAALSKELGGTDVDVYAASTALQNVHIIQPRPSLIAKYHQADLVVCTGSELEVGWLPPLVEKGNNSKALPGTPGSFEASRYVSMLDIPARLDRSDGDVHPYGNPHIQTGPQNIAPVAKALAERLAAVDSAHAGAYQKRYQDFSKRWTAAMEKWSARVKPLNGVSVVSFHKSWAYLYKFAGIEEVSTLEPKPGIPPSGAHLEEVLSELKTRPAKMVVYAAYEDRRAADWLGQRAKIPVVELPFSTGGAQGTDDLFGLYDVTLNRLLQALSDNKS